MEEIENCEAVASSEVIIIDGKSNGVADVDDDGKLRKSKGPRRSSTANWTEEEDDILEDAVKKYEGKCWKKIAKCLPGRTDVQCLHRWQKVLNPNLIKGPWKKEEDILLIELVGKFGDGEKKWSKIAKELPGRIGKQCRERWYNHLNPEINKAPWTKEEENILINAHSEHGNKWSMIAKFLPGRTENSVKNHWNCSMKRRYGNHISVIKRRVDSESCNENPKYNNEELSNYTGLCYEPVDVTNFYLSSGRCPSLENYRGEASDSKCSSSSSPSYIKESSANLFRRMDSMLSTAATSFDMPSIITTKRPKHAFDKDVSSNTHDKQD